MFPTHVGMNGENHPGLGYESHVPHTRGDERAGGGNSLRIFQCSPHTWG